MENNQKLEVKSLDILISEDNDEVCKLYEKVLRHRGHRPNITKSGEECLKVYNSELDKQGNDSPPFDVVLLDYALPEKNGVDVSKEILEKAPNQRIIFSSAYLDKLIRDLQKINLNAEIYPKFSTLESFINFVEGTKS
jgi:CheY-like chemotaxis protein